MVFLIKRWGEKPMTIRERFRGVANGDPDTDAGPVMEWATWWDKTIEGWEREGLPGDLGNQGLFGHFGLDRHFQFWLPTKTEQCPQPKSHGAPIVTNLAEYKNIKHLLYPNDAVEGMAALIEEAVPYYESGMGLVWYTLEGFFWFPRTLLGIEGHLYSFYDEPELYHYICEDLLEWHLNMLEKLSRYFNADFMTMAEDMSYNNGPMVSRELFEEFMAPYYRRLIPEIKKRGTRVIVDSDGDIALTVPWFIGCGAEGILPLEKQAGVDIGLLQELYPEFLFLGGFDKMCLFHGREAIDREMRRILPMLRRGRFIPSIDHQTPPGVSLEDYKYYVSRLREISIQACKDAK